MSCQYVLCKQVNRNLEIQRVNCYESRGLSVERMIRDAVRRYHITKDFEFAVNTYDIPEEVVQGIPNFHFCNTHDYEKLFPDFMYYGWTEINVPNYTKLVHQLQQYSKTDPTTNKAGWIGVLNQHPTRQLLYDRSINLEKIECIPITWERDNSGTLKACNYMSYHDHVKKWKYLIDVEGCGWSARLKVFLSSPRITFIVDRPCKDWCFNFIKPWVHYVPVNRDLSDLEENYDKIESDIELQRNILNEKTKLNDVCLSYNSALNQIHNLITNFTQ